MNKATLFSLGKPQNRSPQLPGFTLRQPMAGRSQVGTLARAVATLAL